MRVGGSELFDVDFRLVAATNKDLEKEIAEGRFREDLYYRLKVVTLRIPPLRDRREDIPPIAEHYLRQFVKEHGRDPKRFSREAAAALVAYPWPGNVRELRNAIESIVVFHRGDEIRAADLPPEIRPYAIEDGGAEVDAVAADRSPAPESAPEPREEPSSGYVIPPAATAAAPVASATRTMADIERDAILSMLERTGGRRIDAARRLDIGLRTLQRKLKEYKDQGLYEEPS